MTSPKTQLQRVRKILGYKQVQVVRLLLQHAAAHNLVIATEAALRIMLSRWENGHDRVTDPIYQMLFREIYGRPNEELGFPTEVADESADELRDRILSARSIDAATIELFRRQVDAVRHLDRRVGAITLLDQLNTQVDQMSDLLRFGTLGRHRASLGAVLAEFATLAGWEALDRGSLMLAWRHHETAKNAAREADSLPLLAYATAQQAFVLVDLGEPGAALDVLDHVRSRRATAVPPLLRCWLAAAHGEGLAVCRQRDAALRAFDDAISALPAETKDPDLAYLMLNGTHLSRWRDNALTRLGDPVAANELETVLASSTPTTARATASVLVDLAYAYTRAGDRDGAVGYMRRARQIASRIGSERQKRRLRGLVLPGTM
jgi:tetratricopeptide (TPR) repeat protein